MHLFLRKEREREKEEKRENVKKEENERRRLRKIWVEWTIGLPN